MGLKITRSQRLSAVIGISSIFFVAEISIGFYTHSLALVADAFHYLNDLIGFVVALVALRVSETDDAPKSLSFGWQRAQLLGAFFNGALLFALGISVFLQSIERFISLQYVENPKLMFIMGAVGLGLNLISAMFLHEHDHAHSHHGHSAVPLPAIPPIAGEADISEHRYHKHQLHTSQPIPTRYDLGMLGVLLHVVSDAANNLGVITAALVIWLTHYEGRYYADPGTSMGIAMMIILTSLPLGIHFHLGQHCHDLAKMWVVRRSGLILLESAPNDVDPADVKHDLERIPGVLAIHELHIWRLNQSKTLASVHIVVSDPSVANFAKTTKTINECFHAYGIHSATLQPETSPLADVPSMGYPPGGITQELRKRSLEKCQVTCGALCEELTCCG